MMLSRWILVAVTALCIALFYFPLGHDDYVGRWGDGTYGIETDGNSSAVVGAVAPGSPAAAAGVRPGDVIITAPFERTYLDAEVPIAGQRLAFDVRHADGSVAHVAMTAVPVPGFSAWDRITGIAAILPATIFLVVACMLVYFRPGVMTWSFFIFAAGYFSTAPSFQFYRAYLPRDVYVGLTYVLTVLLGSFSVQFLIPYLLRFPDERLDGWRRIADRCWWGLIAVSFFAYSYEWWYEVTTASHMPGRQVLEYVLPLATFVAAAFILAKKIKAATPQIRERMRFLSIGVLVSFVAYGVYFVPFFSDAAKQLIGYLAALMPITIAYAVFRHRVIDVNFVLNRALGYGIVSVVVIAAVSLLDYLFSSLVSKQHFAVLGELGITIAVGFLLDRINKAVSGILERTLFRHRMLAEEHLKRVAAALPFATDESAVSGGLTEMPASALRLSAAALYRVRDDNKGFTGVATSHDTPMAPAAFEANHLLVRMMQAWEKPVWLDEVRQYLDRDNSSIYVVAVPVTVRHELVAFTLYGAHVNGSQIDPQELALLVELSREASRAYDHVEAVRTRERFAGLTATRAVEIA